METTVQSGSFTLLDVSRHLFPRICGVVHFRDQLRMLCGGRRLEQTKHFFPKIYKNCATRVNVFLSFWWILEACVPSEIVPPPFFTGYDEDHFYVLKT